jgi:uroporphyrinogen-III synthase
VPKVLVTRAADQAGNLVTRLRELDCDVLEFPLIEIVEPADGGAALRASIHAAGFDNRYRWIVLTSPNAAYRALSVLPTANGSLIAAIGPGTALVCEELGHPVSLMPDRSIGEGLVEAFAAASDHAMGQLPQRILLPQAEAARDVVAKGLRAKGWIVDVVVAYRTLPRRPSLAECEEACTADIALLTSSSTATALINAVGLDRLPKTLISIGPQTTATLVHLGAVVTITADPHSLDGLVRALMKFLA